MPGHQLRIADSKVEGDDPAYEEGGRRRPAAPRRVQHKPTPHHRREPASSKPLRGVALAMTTKHERQHRMAESWKNTRPAERNTSGRSTSRGRRRAAGRRRRSSHRRARPPSRPMEGMLFTSCWAESLAKRNPPSCAGAKRRNTLSLFRPTSPAPRSLRACGGHWSPRRPAIGHVARHEDARPRRRSSGSRPGSASALPPRLRSPPAAANSAGTISTRSRHSPGRIIEASRLRLVITACWSVTSAMMSV